MSTESAKETLFREKTLSHLEQLTGRSFRTRDDVRAYVNELAVEQAGRRFSRVVGWRMVKRSALGALFAMAAGQYYFVDMLNEMMSMNSVIVFVPVKNNYTGSPVPLPSTYLSRTTL